MNYFHLLETRAIFNSSLCICILHVYMLSPSVMSDSATPWTVAHQAPLSMGFSRQEHHSELPFPPPGDLPDSGIEPASPVSPALTGGFFTTESCILQSLINNCLVLFSKENTGKGRQRRGSYFYFRDQSHRWHLGLESWKLTIHFCRSGL